jgi:hypothetical protein
MMMIREEIIDILYLIGGTYVNVCIFIFVSYIYIYNSSDDHDVKGDNRYFIFDWGYVY